MHSRRLPATTQRPSGSARQPASGAVAPLIRSPRLKVSALSQRARTSPRSAHGGCCRRFRRGWPPQPPALPPCLHDGAEVLMMERTARAATRRSPVFRWMTTAGDERQCEVRPTRSVGGRACPAAVSQQLEHRDAPSVPNSARSPVGKAPPLHHRTGPQAVPTDLGLLWPSPRAIQNINRACTATMSTLAE